MIFGNCFVKKFIILLNPYVKDICKQSKTNDSITFFNLYIILKQLRLKKWSPSSKDPAFDQSVGMEYLKHKKKFCMSLLYILLTSLIDLIIIVFQKSPSKPEFRKIFVSDFAFPLCQLETNFFWRCWIIKFFEDVSNVFWYI